MDFIKLGSDRMKITLSRDDMDEYSVNCESLDYGDTGTRRAFWSILDEANRKTGFNAASGRAYIQVYRSKEGGCELFVTMLPDGLGPAASDGLSLSCNDGPPTAGDFFYFESIEDMLRACAALDGLGYAGVSRGYGVRPEGYCLALFPENGCSADFLCEFGRRLDLDAAESFFSEHCSIICEENAVETLAKLC